MPYYNGNRFTASAVSQQRLLFVLPFRQRSHFFNIILQLYINVTNELFLVELNVNFFDRKVLFIACIHTP